MAMHVPNELETFRHFVDEQVSTGSVQSVDELIDRYRKYQEELRRFRAEVEPSLAESARGESSPLDVEAMLSELRRRLGEKGITD